MFAVDHVFDQPQSDQIDPSILQDALSSMSDEDLERLEDDLDFCNFAGVPSRRILDVLEKVVELDEGWRRLRRRDAPLSVPQPF